MHRLTLPGNAWIDVKEQDEITVKDDREMYDFAAIQWVNGEPQFDPMRFAVARAAARIVNWSMNRTDGTPIRWQAGQPFKSRVGTLDLLTAKQFAPLGKAIAEFYDAADKEASEEEAKNASADGANA